MYTSPRGLPNLEFVIERHFRRSSWQDEKLFLLLSRSRREPTTSRTPRLHSKKGDPHPTRSAIGRLNNKQSNVYYTTTLFWIIWQLLTQVLLMCYWGITPEYYLRVLLWCYPGVTQVLLGYNTWLLTEGVTLVLLWCYPGVTQVLLWCQMWAAEVEFGLIFGL